jgi:NADPH:quinone reductase-like Zn-dependent oxidoreductase
VTRDVWRIDRAGSLDRLTRRAEALAAPGPGEARVSVRAIGLNFADIFACLGLYSATPKGSFVPGLEFSGVIEALGPPAPGDTHPAPLQVGDPVVGLTRFGAYATALNVRTPYLRAIRPGWSFVQAAAYPVQALTAWYGLVRLGELGRDDVVLVQSAAGGVGLHALTIAGGLGARTIAAVGREEKRQWLIAHRGLDPALVVVRERRTFGAALDRALAALGADGFDLGFDAVAGPFLRPAYDRLRPAGRLVTYGAADFMPHRARANYARLALQYLRRPRIDPLQMMSDNRSVMGFNLIWLWEQAALLPDACDRIDALIPSPAEIARVVPFGHAPDAMRHLQSGATIGKVVLEV